jgi:predicted KAP-like P-loop ATPase
MIGQNLFSGKEKKNDDEFLSDFQDTIEKSLREEKTQLLMTKKLQAKFKEMVKTLLENNFTIEDVNLLANCNKKFQIKEGAIKDDLS